MNALTDKTITDLQQLRRELKRVREQGCAVDLLPMKEAIRAWNEAEGAVIGLLHVTC